MGGPHYKYVGIEVGGGEGSLASPRFAWFDKVLANGNGMIKAGFPLTYELPVKELPKKSWVKISQIRTLSTERLGKRIGRVEPEDLDRILEGLNEIIGGG